MPAPPVYLDECVDVFVAVALRERGFRATAAREQAMIGVSDEAQLEYASGQGWVLLSHNARDFQRLHKRLQSEERKHSGIILIPDTGPILRLALRAAMTLDWLAEKDYRSGLLKWGHLQFQLTQGYRVAGYNEQQVEYALARR